MREISYCECEICGQRFEDSWECQLHELGHMADDFPHDELNMWDSQGNPISAKELSDYRTFDRIFAIETANVKAKEYLCELCYFLSERYPYKNNEGEDGLVYYDEDCDEWVSLADKQRELDAIREKYSKGL